MAWDERPARNQGVLETRVVGAVMAEARVDGEERESEMEDEGEERTRRGEDEEDERVRARFR